jgi:cytochrome c biogenesis protein CcmG, thiol:disulfide interchange protein DsbE
LFLSVSVLATLTGCNSRQAPIGAAPILEMKTFFGETVKVDGKDAKATLLVFWATWCGPCIMEIPNLKAMHAKYGDRNFRVISILVDDQKGVKALPIMQRFGINYPVLVGTEQDMADFGGVNALPTAFLIDSEGILRDKIQGLVSEAELERRILRLL